MGNFNAKKGKRDDYNVSKQQKKKNNHIADSTMIKRFNSDENLDQNNLTDSINSSEKQKSIIDNLSEEKCDDTDQQEHQEVNDLTTEIPHAALLSPVDEKDPSDSNNLSDKKNFIIGNPSEEKCDDTDQQEHQDDLATKIPQAALSSPVDEKDPSDSTNLSDKKKAIIGNSSEEKCDDIEQQKHQEVNDLATEIPQAASSSAVDENDPSDSTNLTDKKKAIIENFSEEKGDDTDQQEHQEGNDLTTEIPQAALSSPVDEKDPSDSTNSSNKKKSIIDNSSEEKCDDTDQQEHQEGNDLATEIPQQALSSPVDEKDLSDLTNSSDKMKSTIANSLEEKCDDTDKQDQLEKNDLTSKISQVASSSPVNEKDLSDSTNSSDKKKAIIDNSSEEKCDDTDQQEHHEGNDLAAENFQAASSSSSVDEKDLSDSTNLSNKMKSKSANSLEEKCDDIDKQDHLERNDLASEISQVGSSSSIEGKDLSDLTNSSDKMKSTSDNYLEEKCDYTDQQNNHSEFSKIESDDKDSNPNTSSKEEATDDGLNKECQYKEDLSKTEVANPASSTLNYLGDHQEKSNSISENNDKLLIKSENKNDKNDENNKDHLSAPAENQTFDNKQVQLPSENIDVDNSEMKIISLDDKFTFNPKKLNLDKKSVEYIDAILKEAKKYEDQVESFSNTSSSMEHFILDENLMQLVDHLDKIKCKKGEEQYAPKIAALKYIQNLQDKLDDNTIPEEE